MFLFHCFQILKYKLPQLHIFIRKIDYFNYKLKLIFMTLVHKRTIPSNDRRLSAKLVPILQLEGVAWSAQRIPQPLISIF
jgi:hypothetical protein